MLDFAVRNFCGLNCVSFPATSDVEALTPNVTVLGHGTYKEVIKVKRGRYVALTCQDWCPNQQRRHQSSPSTCAQRKGHGGSQREGSHRSPKRESSPDTNAAATLTLDFSLQTEKIHVCCLSPRNAVRAAGTGRAGPGVGQTVFSRLRPAVASVTGFLQTKLRLRHAFG